VPFDQAQLIVSAGRLYLVSGAVYEVGRQTQTLMPVLTTGDVITDLKVGWLSSATLDSGQLVVSDGHSLFRLDAGGTWSGEQLASAGKAGGWSIDASGAFDGSYYLLDPGEQQVMKFPARHYSDDPTGWLHASTLDLAANVVDMAVDGKIYLLTADGVLHVLEAGDESVGLAVLPQSDSATPVALYGDATSTYVYVFENAGGQGNLIRYDRSNQQTALLQAPLPDPFVDNSAALVAFASAQEFAVNEEGGVIYFLTSDGLWSASLN